MYFSVKEIFCYYGDVEYVDDFQPYDKNEIFKYAFRKHKDFSYQDEFRLLINTKIPKDDVFECEIGDLTSFS